MKIAHIAPIKHIELAQKASSIHMTIAHWFEDGKYFKLWHDFKKNNPTSYIIVDNGYYELGHSLEFEYCLNKALAVNANCIVLSDGPVQSSELKLAKSKGLQVMAVPTSIEDFHSCMSDPGIDKVGLGSLHVVNMMQGVVAQDLIYPKFDYRNRSNFLDATLNPSYDISKIHLLGIADSVAEITLCRGKAGSLDTSAAIWRGINGVDIRTPGKFNISLDIHSELPFNEQAQANIDLVDKHARTWL